MAGWGYGLLGPVEVRVDGRAVEVAGAKQRLVLAMLLLGANQLVPVGRAGRGSPGRYRAAR